MGFNQDMLRLARVSLGKTQKDVATELGISQGKVAKWEDGLFAPSDAEIEKLSSCLMLPAEGFQCDVDVTNFATCCMYHRKRQRLPATVLNQIHAKVNLTAIGIMRLLKNVSFNVESPIPSMDVDEYDGPKHVANELRRVWKMGLEPVKSLVNYVEAAGGIVVPTQFGTKDLDAVSLWPRGCTPLFFVNAEVPTDRWRFTLSHELGHIVMHRLPSANAEEEADEFASEFLMPSVAIADELRGLTLGGAARLKLRWRTSMSSLIMKAKDVRAISPYTHKSLFMELSAAGYRRKEPVEIDPEYPETLERLLSFHRNNLFYSQDQLHSLLLCSDYEQFKDRFTYTKQDQQKLKLFG